MSEHEKDRYMHVHIFNDPQKRSWNNKSCNIVPSVHFIKSSSSLTDFVIPIDSELVNQNYQERERVLNTVLKTELGSLSKVEFAPVLFILLLWMIIYKVKKLLLTSLWE